MCSSSTSHVLFIVSRQWVVLDVLKAPLRASDTRFWIIIARTSWNKVLKLCTRCTYTTIMLCEMSEQTDVRLTDERILPVCWKWMMDGRTDGRMSDPRNREQATPLVTLSTVQNTTFSICKLYYEPFFASSIYVPFLTLLRYECVILHHSMPDSKAK